MVVFVVVLLKIRLNALLFFVVLLLFESCLSGNRLFGQLPMIDLCFCLLEFPPEISETWFQHVAASLCKVLVVSSHGEIPLSRF